MSDAPTLSRDEIAYHLRLVAQVSAANAAWQSWSAHIAAKYELAQGDAVDEKGAIVRKPVEIEAVA
jgi:hypothetical protein